MIKYTSFGAARQVTGSMHYFECNGVNILMDCGLDYEKGEFGEPVSNKSFAFEPAKVDVLILSHAHIDHSGNIPNLVRQGFSGPIYCTHATGKLVTDLWKDSLNIQLSESKKNKRRKGKNAEVLYSFHDIYKAQEQLIYVNYRSPKKITDEIEFEYYQAGHIPGAGSIKLSVWEGNKCTCIGFTGDLGNYQAALVQDPEPMKGIQYLLNESTYGARNHTREKSKQEALLQHIEEVCIQNKGKLVIPAFSIGRTQAILFTLHQLYRAGKLPTWLNIYSDSPLAIRSTGVYLEFTEILNQEAQKFAIDYEGLFRFPNLQVLTEPAQSDYISQNEEPSIIVSAAGMLEGGRIQKHIRNNIGFTNSRVLIAGYCSEGTLGHKLLSGLDYITINKRERQVKASIARTDAFSAHADQEGLLNYMSQVNQKGDLKKIFLVHGDENNMEVLKKAIPFSKVVIPAKEESFSLT